MWSKILYGLLIIFILVACGSKNQTSENKTLTSDNHTTGLIGEWTINSRYGLLCNACPIINFNNNNTAVLKFPNNRTENYRWQITLDTLTLISNSFTPTSSTIPYFMNFKYQMTYKPEKNFLELKLTHIKEKTYLLRCWHK
ncbi:hypothetical protein CNR22_16365 [Sphingobacteriaceae bacterium]|nr:hypothetical protein CNR22_16365 [Sphingobacteriaceae bacterium]